MGQGPSAQRTIYEDEDRYVFFDDTDNAEPVEAKTNGTAREYTAHCILEVEKILDNTALGRKNAGAHFFRYMSERDETKAMVAPKIRMTLLIHSESDDVFKQSLRKFAPSSECESENIRTNTAAPAVRADTVSIQALIQRGSAASSSPAASPRVSVAPVTQPQADSIRPRVNN